MMETLNGKYYLYGMEIMNEIKSRNNRNQLSDVLVGFGMGNDATP